MKGLPPLSLPTLLCLRNSLCVMSRGMSTLHRRSPFPHLGPSTYTAAQTSEGIACRSPCLLIQHGPPAAHFHGSNHYIWELHPDSSQVPICLRNLSTYPIVIPTEVVVSKVTPANWVSPVALPAESSGKTAHNPQKKWILEELNLQGLEEWPREEQDKARKLLVRWEHLFGNSNLDLGKTSLMKHQFELTDWLPFKECCNGTCTMI